MSSWEEKDDQWRRHSFCDVHSRLWQLCWAVEALPAEVQRSHEGGKDLIPDSHFREKIFGFIFAGFQGERQMEAELSNLGGEVMAGQQLQVCLPLFQHMLFGIHLYQEFPVHPPSQTCASPLLTQAPCRPWLPVRETSCSPTAMASSFNCRAAWKRWSKKNQAFTHSIELVEAKMLYTIKNYSGNYSKLESMCTVTPIFHMME